MTALPHGFEWGRVGGDTACLVDRRVGLALAIPGHPRVSPATASSGTTEPVYEVLVELEDAPVALRYRHNELPDGAAPDSLLLVDTYAANRSRREDRRRAQPGSAVQCRAWGVDAAASTLYPLEHKDAAGHDMEEVLLLVRARSQVVITKRFSRATMPWITWSLLSSALAAGVHWAPPGSSVPAPPSLWPASTFLHPGIRGVLAAARQADAARLAELAASHRAATKPLADALAALIRGAEPPADPCTDDQRAQLAAFLEDRAGVPALGQAFADLVRDVKSAHDLRGLAVLGLHALGAQPATFASTSVDDARAFGYLAE